MTRLSIAVLSISASLLLSHVSFAQTDLPNNHPAFTRGAFCSGPLQRTYNPQPITPGPLRLTAVYCHLGKINSHYNQLPGISPDGQKRATFGEERRVLLIMDMAEREASARYDSGATFTTWSFRSEPFVRWSSDSRFLWAGRQSGILPSGFAQNPLEPVKVSLDGQVTALPPLKHPNGSLDGLLWAGNNGMALAQFGTRGGSYRPERENPTPTLAFVDASKGRIVESFTLDELSSLLKSPDHPAELRMPISVNAIQQPDGRVRALLRFKDLTVLWTQGRDVRSIPHLPDAVAYRLSPDGKTILLTRPPIPLSALLPGYLHVTHCERFRPPVCQPRRLIDAPVALLLDAVTGQTIWTLSAKSDPSDLFPDAELSPDGRFALVGMGPPDVGEHEEQTILYSPRRTIALVSLLDGRIVQAIPAPTGTYTMGFSNGGGSVWVVSASTVSMYAVSHATGPER